MKKALLNAGSIIFVVVILTGAVIAYNYLDRFYSGLEDVPVIGHVIKWARDFTGI